jgi:hypothetical protein
MRKTTRALLLGAVTGAILAGHAQSAAGVEVSREAFGEHCPEVTLGTHSATGGCRISVVGEGDFQMEAFGSLLSACHVDYEMRIDEDGHGYIYNQTAIGTGCTTPICATSGAPRPWEVQIHESAGTMTMQTSSCFESSSVGTINCTYDQQLLIGGHTYEFLALASPCTGPLSFIHITSHAEPLLYNVEFAH